MWSESYFEVGGVLNLFLNAFCVLINFSQILYFRVSFLPHFLLLYLPSTVLSSLNVLNLCMGDRARVYCSFASPPSHQDHLGPQILGWPKKIHLVLFPYDVLETHKLTFYSPIVKLGSLSKPLISESLSAWGLGIDMEIPQLILAYSQESEMLATVMMPRNRIDLIILIHSG